MRWSDYYEKINDWAVSTAVNKISSLEDMGAPDMIVNALNIIDFENEKGAIRLLNRIGLCDEDTVKQALILAKTGNKMF